MIQMHKIRLVYFLMPLVFPMGLSAQTALNICDDVMPPPTLNPLKELSEKNHTIIQQMFEGLVRLDTEGRIEPALAVKWRWVDPLTLEFSLRDGVRFHNGEVFDAEAVRFSVDRFRDPQGGFPGAGFLQSIEKVEVADRLTVRIKTRSPDGILLNLLAGLVSMLPPRYTAALKDPSEFEANPVGTGAFHFKAWDKKGARLLLEANPDYWLKGQPKFRELIFHFLPVEQQVDKLLNGQLDIVTELPGTDTLRVTKSGSSKIIKKESFYTVASSINGTSGPLADKRVRQAVNYAINKEELIRYDVLGNGKPLASLSMAGELGHNPTLKPYPYDPKKAQELLREAGYPKGLRLKAVVKAQGKRTMQIISKQLQRVGITVDIHETNDANVIQDIQKGGWDFTFGGCPNPLGHSFFIQFIFLSSLSPYSLLKDKVYDEMLQKMVSTLDPAKQQEAGEELDRYIHEQAFSLFTYQRIKTYGVRKTVDFAPSITGMPYFHLAAPITDEHAQPRSR